MSVDSYLKPHLAFMDFKLKFDDEKFDNFDVRKLFRALVQDFGKRTQAIDHYRLRLFDYHNRSMYNKVPRIARFYISEHSFDHLTYDFRSFYRPFEDEDLITIDYCDEMLKRYPKHEKTNKIIKQLKIDRPELFI